MLPGIREVLVISTPTKVTLFSTFFGDGSQLGIELQYVVQNELKGLAHGILITEKFLGNEKVGFILSDNLFHGHGLGRQLSANFNLIGA